MDINDATGAPTERPHRPIGEPREPAEGSLEAERMTFERDVVDAALHVGWKPIHPGGALDVPASTLERIEQDRARDVETQTRRLVTAVDDWVRTLETGPWPGNTGSLSRIAEQFGNLDEARCALRAVHIQQALPEDDEPPF